MLTASASFDTTVRLWDIHSSTCLHVLRAASQPIYSLSFAHVHAHSMLAVGSFDGSVTLWDLDGQLMGKFAGNGSTGVYEVMFDRQGRRISVCYADGRVAVLRVAGIA
jgi:WD40 repeat protein